MSVDIGASIFSGMVGSLTGLLSGLLAGKGWWLVVILTGLLAFRLGRAGRLDRAGRAVRDVLAQSWGKGGRGARVGAVAAWVALVGFVVVVDVAHVPSRAEAAAAGAIVAPPVMPTELAAVAGIPAATKPSTAPTSGTAAPVGPKPESTAPLVGMFGGECLLPSNPDAPGTAQAQVVARMRLCFHAMTQAAREEEGQVQIIQNKRAMLAWAAPVMVAPLSDAQVRAKLTPAERAQWAKDDARMAKYAADREVFEAAKDAFFEAFGGRGPFGRLGD